MCNCHRSVFIDVETILCDGKSHPALQYKSKIARIPFPFNMPTYVAIVAIKMTDEVLQLVRDKETLETN